MLFRNLAHGLLWVALLAPISWGTLTEGQRNSLRCLLQEPSNTLVEEVATLMGTCDPLSTCKALLKEKTSADNLEDKELVGKVLKACYHALELPEAVEIAFAERDLQEVFIGRCLERVRELVDGIIDPKAEELEDVRRHILLDLRTRCSYSNLLDVEAYLCGIVHSLVDNHAPSLQIGSPLPLELTENFLTDRVYDKVLSKLVASGKPGQALRISPDGKSLEPFYPAGAISFYAYLDPGKPFTTSASESWEIVPLDSVMYDSANAFNTQDHAFHVPLKGIWLFVAKVWCGENAVGIPMSLALCDNFTTKTYDMTFPRWETSFTFSAKPSGDSDERKRLKMATTVGTYHVSEDNCKVAMMVCSKGKSITVNGDAAPGQGRTALFGVYLGE